MRWILVFLRPRRLWWPTLWGWLVLLVLAACTVTLAARHAGTYLAPNEPLPHARTLVVEGWLDVPELSQVMAAVQRGHYERVLVTGGPMEPWDDHPQWHSLADRAADYLTHHGLSKMPVVAVPTPASAQDRSFLSAVQVREWLQQTSPADDGIDVFSAGAHARRSRLVYRMAFGPQARIGILSAAPTGYEPRHWWLTSAGTKAVLGETLSLAWTTCCFFPPPRGSHDERWGVPASASRARD